MPDLEIGTKERVLETFLAFVGRHGRMKRVRVATMGGTGREAQLWQRAGIPGDNGWLIERARNRSEALLGSDLPYRVTANLSTLARVFASVYGAEVGLDALHLDLCGTLEAQVDAIRPALPLLFKDAAGARCLAITVADARRNASLEDFRAVWYRSFSLIGAKNAQAFLAALKAEQRAMPPSERGPRQSGLNPEKAARREFGLFVELGELLRTFPYLPETMARYAYVSRTSGSPFRMRTYVFRFGREDGEALPRSQEFAKRWLASALSFVTEAGMVPVQFVPEPLPEKEHVPVSKPKDPFANLRQIVALMAPAAQAEFAKLEADAAKNAQIAQERDTAKAELAELQGRIDDLKKRVKVALGDVPAPPPAAEPVPAGRQSGAIARPTAHAARTASPGTERNIEAQLVLLRGKAQGPEALEAAYANARGMLGLGRMKKWKPVVGALLARTQGAFRTNFVKRAFEATPEEKRQALLEELAGVYTRTVGRTITPQILSMEIGA